jgi:hypothetical protein
LARKNQHPEPKDAQRQKLADDVAVFLRKGGTIEKIESGVSGVDLAKPGAKSIKLGKPK